MRLFWSSRSPFVRKVMIVAHELGIASDIETIRVSVSSATVTPDVMRHNPIGKIPTLVLENGDVLHDSAVICEYLDATYGGGAFFPARGAERWRALKLQALADGIMETDVMWLGERVRPVDDHSASRMATCRTKIVAAADALERDADSLAIEAITIGEVATVSALAHLDFRFPDERWREGRPKLAAWFEAMGRRPSVQATAFVDQY